jgi:hypothetical protein
LHNAGCRKPRSARSRQPKRPAGIDVAGNDDPIAATEVADVEHCRDRLQLGNGDLAMPLPTAIGARAAANLRRSIIIEATSHTNS